MQHFVYHQHVKCASVKCYFKIYLIRLKWNSTSDFIQRNWWYFNKWILQYFVCFTWKNLKKCDIPHKKHLWTRECLPVTITHLILASFNWLITAADSLFSLFCISNNPTNERSVSTCVYVSKRYKYCLEYKTNLHKMHMDKINSIYNHTSLNSS